MMFHLYLMVFAVVMMMKNVDGRICVCAQFIKDECIAEDNCEWNEVLPIGRNKQNHGTPGVCRSDQFMTCHRNKSCTLQSRDPRLSTVPPMQPMLMADIIAADLKLRADAPPADDQSNGADPEETDNLDWPWNCDNDPDGKVVYSSSLVNVKEMDQATYQLMVNHNKQNKLGMEHKAEQTALFTNLSGIHLMQTVVGLTFFVIMIGAIFYCKCKRPTSAESKQLSFDDDSYSTFTQRV